MDGMDHEHLFPREGILEIWSLEIIFLFFEKSSLITLK